MMRTTVAALIAILATTAALAPGLAPALADVLPPQRPTRPSDERRVTGIVRGFAGASLALRDPQSGATSTFNLYGHRGPVRADAIGLRLGDTAVVTVRDDLARGEEHTVDRVLPEGQTVIRVFALNLPLTPPALPRVRAAGSRRVPARASSSASRRCHAASRCAMDRTARSRARRR